MSIESGPYCRHCVGDDGELRAFDEVLERFKQWARRTDPSLSDAAAERSSLEFMASMPAWQAHPRVVRPET